MEDDSGQHERQPDGQCRSAVAHRDQQGRRCDIALLNRVIECGIKQAAQENGGEKQTDRRDECLFPFIEEMQKDRQAQMFMPVDGDCGTKHGKPEKREGCAFIHPDKRRGKHIACGHADQQDRYDECQQSRTDNLDRPHPTRARHRLLKLHRRQVVHHFGTHRHLSPPQWQPDHQLHLLQAER
ncbi:hypothetical protein D3C73_1059710 [compost metagenome]